MEITVHRDNAYGATEINEIQFHRESLVSVCTETSKLWYMTVDTCVKEDPFVVYKDMLPDWN